MVELTALRKEIDALDKEIVSLIIKRFDIVNGVAKYKIENNMEVFDPKREDLIIENKISQFKEAGLDDPKFVSELFHLLMDKSKDLQKDIINNNK